ncbi:hypothetical protein ACQJBY_051613 [Aegilops geniculata]
MPMEQAFMHCDKDTLKMAMLKHEETFRQQVHDLHRLYRIQKLLMRDLKREIKSQQSGLSASPNGSPGAEYDHHRRASALDACSYEQQWQYGATTTRRGSHAAATPRAAQAQLSPEATDDEEAELELTLAVGSGGKKRYSDGHCSPGESFSSSTTESDTLTGGQDWQQAQAQHQLVGTGAGAGSPYHKRRPAGFGAEQAEDGGVQQPSPLLLHWLSLRMA